MLCAPVCVSNKQHTFYTKYFLKLDQLISRTLNSQNWLANVFAMTHLNRLQNPHSHFEFCDDDGTVIAKVGPVVDNLRYIPKSMEKYIKSSPAAWTPNFGQIFLDALTLLGGTGTNYEIKVIALKSPVVDAQCLFLNSMHGIEKKGHNDLGRIMYALKMNGLVNLNPKSRLWSIGPRPIFVPNFASTFNCTAFESQQKLRFATPTAPFTYKDVAFKGQMVEVPGLENIDSIQLRSTNRKKMIRVLPNKLTTFAGITLDSALLASSAGNSTKLDIVWILQRSPFIRPQSNDDCPGHYNFQNKVGRVLNGFRGRFLTITKEGWKTV